MRKSGGFISIKNRYNHTVAGCDNTFNSHPDNIIDGLSAALKVHFDVEFTATKIPLPANYTIMNQQLIKYHREDNNIYYGDQFWAKGGCVHEVNKSAGDALFYGFLFDSKSKTLKKIDPNLKDSFAEDFNRAYGGNPKLTVHKGNLTLNGEILIGAEESQIKTLYLPKVKEMGDHCLQNARALKTMDAQALKTMGEFCLYNAGALTKLNVPALITMGDCCLYNAQALTRLDAPALETMGYRCLNSAWALTRLGVPKLRVVHKHPEYLR